MFAAKAGLFATIAAEVGSGFAMKNLYENPKKPRTIRQEFVSAWPGNQKHRPISWLAGYFDPPQLFAAYKTHGLGVVIRNAIN